jgi:hypothetical protein
LTEERRLSSVFYVCTAEALFSNRSLGKQGRGDALLPAQPFKTTRIFSSAEKCRRVARRMSLIASSAGCFSGPDLCLIFAPCGYDDPEILSS